MCALTSFRLAPSLPLACQSFPMPPGPSGVLRILFHSLQRQLLSAIHQMTHLYLSAVTTVLPRATSSLVAPRHLSSHAPGPIPLSVSGHLRCAQHVAVPAWHHQPIERDGRVDAVRRGREGGQHRSQTAPSLPPGPSFTS